MGNLKAHFGHRLAWLRRQQGLTQEDLAEMAQVSVDFIGLMERGQRAPSFGTLERLASALGVTVADLFTFDSEKQEVIMIALQPSRKEVAEVFGYLSHSTVPAAVSARSQHLCPFQQGKEATQQCSKLSQHRVFDQFGQSGMPFGACSVWHRGRGDKQFRPAIICPFRFTQDQRVFREARQVLKGSAAQSRFLVLQEVGLPLGRLDYILVNIEPDADRVLDFCVLETMALSTTTTGHVIRSMFEVLGIAPALPIYKYGLNLRQVVSRMII